MSEESVLTQEAAPVENTSSGTWRESLPEDLRESGSLKDIPDVNTLAKAYSDAQSYIGRSIRIPGEDAGEDVWSDFNQKLTNVPGVARIPSEDSAAEDWSAFYNRMGRPESADAYSITRPEGAEASEAEGALLAKLHEIGLNNSQANNLVNWMNDGVTTATHERNNSMNASLSSLKDDWGQAFDSKLQDAKSAIGHFGGEELLQEINGSGLGNNVRLIKAFAEIGRGFSEDPAMSVGGKQNAGMTPTEAKEQIDEILGNAAHPYNDLDNPAHDAAVDKVQKLYQAAYLSDDDAEPDIFERKLGLG